MNLRDQMQIDAQKVFFNPLEFGEIHEINLLQKGADKGFPANYTPPAALIIIIDDDELQDRKSSASNPTDGVYEASLLFHARKSDFILAFNKIPVLQSQLKLDGKTYKVTDLQDDGIIIKVTLSGNRS